MAEKIKCNPGCRGSIQEILIQHKGLQRFFRLHYPNYTALRPQWQQKSRRQAADIPPNYQIRKAGASGKTKRIYFLTSTRVKWAVFQYGRCARKCRQKLRRVGWQGTFTFCITFLYDSATFRGTCRIIRNIYWICKWVWVRVVFCNKEKATCHEIVSKWDSHSLASKCHWIKILKKVPILTNWKGHKWHWHGLDLACLYCF